ncbi:hypothetical protein [Microvirga makkahensis]|uniref:Uncharacterized protein n=1 Tax=Microvirga makkahensis TaxID=1128670 RepID=A0A7X3MMZ3_9HYPH|nr:hypothetical protein [Microvirga makkahensis]MXQ10061.1 hypothetical protein [Microvirga makkahensis]
MVSKDLATLYGRVALVVFAFAFVAAIVAGPLFQKAGLGRSVTAAQETPAPEIIRVKATPVVGGRG